MTDTQFIDALERRGVTPTDACDTLASLLEYEVPISDCSTLEQALECGIEVVDETLRWVQCGSWLAELHVPRRDAFVAALRAGE
jgi:hypothetical protein